MADREDVYCTLVMSDNYLPGAAVLAHSLRDSGTTQKLAVMITVESLRYDTISELRTLFDYVIPVDRIANPSPSNLYLMDRGDLLYAFTKINLWRLTQFRKIVYVDADIVALRAPDELFDTKAPFAAAPDVGWPDIFNTGVMVLNPDMGTYWGLQTMAASGDSFDGADQGLINQYYEHKKWHRLSFTYNCTPSASYQYEPAYRFFKSRVAMVHFIGQDKPWLKGRSASMSSSGAYKELVSRWWMVYDHHYRSGELNGESAVRSLVRGEQQYWDRFAPKPVLQPPTITIEPPPTDPADPVAGIKHDEPTPVPAMQHQPWSAPQNEWDATRASPPTASRPEAPNFPSQSYDFNADPTPFRPPASYPEPPKDMWYQVPHDPPLPREARPNPIFPWEMREQARPTRFFAEDYVPPPVTAPPESHLPTASSEEDLAPTITLNDDQPPTMDTEPRNAWDEHPGINNYIRQLSQWQRLRGKIQVLSHIPHQAQTPNTEVQDPIAAAFTGEVAPDEEPEESEATESLKLTHFPTAIERPSLPVTPAPIRRTMFWGAEPNAGQLSQAEGVPDQADWNPQASLERLRVNSLTLDPSQLHLPAKNVPKRDMVATATGFTSNTSPTGTGHVSPVTARSPGADGHVHFLDEVVRTGTPGAAEGVKSAADSSTVGAA